MTGQVKVLAWSRYDAEKQDNLVDTSKLFSSVGWNLVNWNVERTRICLSESTPSYGVDSSFAFSFLRVLPEPNLQGNEESRGSHHSFFTYEPLWTCLVRRYFLPLQLDTLAFGQFESSFHCARLHFLCRRKTCTHAPTRSSIKTKPGCLLSPG